MRETIQTKIIQTLESATKKSLSVDELAQKLSLNKSADFKLLVQAIAQLERDKKVAFNRKGKIYLPKAAVYIEGVFRANERGFGFVTIADDEADVYIAPEDTAYAMDGDVVAIDILRPANPFLEKTAEGKIVEIKKRAITKVVGEFVSFPPEEIASSGLLGQVIAKDKKLANFTFLVAPTGLHPVEGQIVLFDVTHYPEKGYAKSLEGNIVQILGHKNDPGMDILSIVIANGIPTDFPDEVKQQLNDIPDEINPAEFSHRRDLRNETLVTIDGEDAKDLDDAVSLKKLANGNYQLGVHIADVSYYVTENSPLDQEAFDRGTSVYLTDRVIPMLPHILSNGICSLNAGEDRLALSCIMWIDRKGNVTDHKITETVIRVDERMSYTSVKKILEEQDEAECERYQELIPMFERMRDLASILRAKRKKRGSIDFDFPETKMILDENGVPLELRPYDRNVATKIIEDFMLIANETVAEDFFWQEIPFVYRTHDVPDEDKIKKFSTFVNNFGHSLHISNKEVHPKEIQKLLAKAEGTPEEDLISRLALRSMKRARYTPENTGHFGLAASYYCHFTSPIRRYPDLQIHRIIKETLRGRMDAKRQEHYESILPEVTQKCSELERRADEAERETVKLKKVEYMKQHVGEVFEGVISGVTKWGLYVELGNTVEGLVHVVNMTDDHYDYREDTYEMVGEHLKKAYRLGETVKVQVLGTDDLARTIDFKIVEEQHGKRTGDEADRK